MIKIQLIDVGSDPEFFIIDEKGSFISSTLIAEGTKDDPKHIGNGFYVQRDNLALEGNIPPAKSKDSFIDYMKHLKNYFNNKLIPFGATLAYNGEAEFPHYIANSDEGMEFGCSNVIYSWHNIYYPSENILDINSMPTPELNDSNIRTAGFHIHIGYKIQDNPNKWTKSTIDTIIAKLFDLFIVLPSLSLIKEPYRNSTYGLLGNYRSKAYGIECRALSSTFTEDKYLSWIWDSIEDMFEYFNKMTEKEMLDLLNISTYDDTTPDIVESLLYSWKQEEIYKIIKSQINKIKIKTTQYETIFN